MGNIQQSLYNLFLYLTLISNDRPKCTVTHEKRIRCLERFGKITPAKSQEGYLYVITIPNIRNFVTKYSTLAESNRNGLINRCFEMDQNNLENRDETKRKCNDYHDANNQRNNFSDNFLIFIDVTKPSEERLNAKYKIEKYIFVPKNRNTSFSRQFKKILDSPEFDTTDAIKPPQILGMYTTTTTSFTYDYSNMSKRKDKPTVYASLLALFYVLFILFLLPFYMVLQLSKSYALFATNMFHTNMQWKIFKSTAFKIDLPR